MLMNHFKRPVWSNKSHHSDIQRVPSAEILTFKNDSAHCLVENTLGKVAKGFLSRAQEAGGIAYRFAPGKQLPFPVWLEEIGSESGSLGRAGRSAWLGGKRQGVFPVVLCLSGLIGCPGFGWREYLTPSAQPASVTVLRGR